VTLSSCNTVFPAGIQLAAERAISVPISVSPSLASLLSHTHRPHHPRRRFKAYRNSKPYHDQDYHRNSSLSPTSISSSHVLFSTSAYASFQRYLAFYLNKFILFIFSVFPRPFFRVPAGNAQQNTQRRSENEKAVLLVPCLCAMTMSSTQLNSIPALNPETEVSSTQTKTEQHQRRRRGCTA
jgi:hypothetical protein